MSTALELTLLTALSALAFAMAVVFGYGVAGVVFAALLSTTGVSILGVVLDWF